MSAANSSHKNFGKGTDRRSCDFGVDNTSRPFTSATAVRMFTRRRSMSKEVDTKCGHFGTVKLVSCLVAAKIGGRDRCIVVVKGTPVPAGDHRPLRVVVSPVPA